MIIDVHSHPHDAGMNVEKLLANMDACGVQKAWIIAWECPWDEYDHIPGAKAEDNGPDPWDAVRLFFTGAMDRLALGYAPDFRRPEALDLMKTGIQNYRVSVCGEVKLRACYDSPDALQVFRYCGERGVPVMLNHTYEYFTGRQTPRSSWWYGGDVFCLERVLRLCPETNFIAGGSGVWHHFADSEERARSPYEEDSVPGLLLTTLLERYGNLYCDASGAEALFALQRDRGRTQALFQAFGDRVLFGRGGLDNGLQSFIDTLPLPQDARDRFYHENAERLIGSIRR